MVTQVIVAPGQSRVVPLPPEFVSAQDVQEKQDCELAAAKRWLTTWGAHYAPRGITLLGDDLYCHQPFCEAVKQHLSNFLATLNLLAFLTHTALEWLDEAYRAVRSSAPSRRTFFENLRTLLQFIPFDNWQHLMQFMLNGGMELPVKI